MTPGMEVEVIGMGVEEETSSTPSDYLESVAVALISNNVSVYNFNLVTLDEFQLYWGEIRGNFAPKGFD